MKMRVLIVGGGISGLSLAYKLKKYSTQNGIPISLQLFEACNQVGGTLQTDFRDGFLLEKGPDCFLSAKPAALQLTKELGIESDLLETREEYRKSYIYLNRKLRQVPQGFYLMAPVQAWPFLCSDLLSLKGKLRTLLEPLVPRNRKSNDESLGSFVRRRFGQEMLDNIAQPMVAGIYTADAQNLSLKATMPKFLELEQTYGSLIQGLRKEKKIGKGTSGPRYSLFLTFKKGMNYLIQNLKDAIGNTSILTQTSIDKTERKDQREWLLTSKTGQKFFGDILCLALPAHQSSFLLQNLSSKASDLLTQIQYLTSAVINFSFQKDQVNKLPAGMGFVIPQKESKSLLACSITHQKFLYRCPENHILLRAFVGGPQAGKLLDSTDSEILEAVQKELAEILKIKGSPVFSVLTRWKQSMPQYTLGHEDRVRQIDEQVSKIPNLYLTGNAYQGVGIPDLISQAEKTAKEIVKKLS